MGAWGYAPWDNDGAADWFGDLFEATRLADRVEEALRLDAEDHHEEIRAAAAAVIMLGRVYVWPVEKLDEHVQLAADRLKELRELAIYEEEPLLTAALDDEIAILEGRADTEKKAPSRGWSDFWSRPDAVEDL
jgi:hypothetical protein